MKIIFRGGSRRLPDGGRFNHITVLILPYPARQVWANSADLDQTLQNAASDQGLHCLPLTQQFYTHSQVVQWDLLKRSVKKSVSGLSNLSKISQENEILCQRGFDWTHSKSAPDLKVIIKYSSLKSLLLSRYPSLSLHYYLCDQTKAIPEYLSHFRDCTVKQCCRRTLKTKSWDQGFP